MSLAMSTRDRSNQGSPPKPLMPRLPTTAPSVRSSPAPRLAAQANKSSPSSAVSRARPRTPQYTSAQPGLKTVDDGGTPSRGVASNVTPRSSARRSKVGSANSTPARAEVNSSGPVSPIECRPSGLGPSASFTSPRSAISEKPPSDTTPRHGQVAGFTPMTATRVAFVSPPLLRTGKTSPPRKSELGPSFFRAGDGPPPAPLPRPELPKKTSSFFYADGRRDSSVAAVTAPTPRSAPPGVRKDQMPQVSENSQWVRPPAAPAQGGRNVAPLSPRETASGYSSPSGLAAIAARSPSPPKFDMHLSYRKGASQIIRPQAPNSPSHSPHSSDGAIAANRQRRQSSLDTTSDPQDEDHRSSISFMGSGALSDTSRGLAVKSMSSVPSPPSHDFTRMSSPPQSTTSPTQRPELARVSSESNENSRLESGGRSMTSPEQETPDSFTARARRERKLLDLEISNSSLLAINRSLEREMRKQKIELRRLRRMTRNNARTSWRSDGTSMPSSNRFGDLDDIVDTDDTVELDGDEEDDVLSDDVSDIASTAFSDEPMSPGSLSQHDARHLREDQKRLQLDLAKHRELLIDSQKMNMSLRRCLGLTEQLIKDGTKALEYHVDTADFRLGGRVLSPEELEGDHAQQEAFTYFDRQTGESTVSIDSVSSSPGGPAGLTIDARRHTSYQLRAISETLSELEKELF